MQEITIQKWIDFYRSKKSMTKFISLLQKEDLMLLSFTPENLVIEEVLPELGILEEDIKNILYEDVRLNNKLMFIVEEKDVNKDIERIEKKVKASAQRAIVDMDDENERNIFKVLLSKIENLKNEKLSEEEKKQKEKLKEITSSKRLLEVEQKIREGLQKEKEELDEILNITKSQFYRDIMNSKTRLVIALYHGVDWMDWKEKYKDEFDQVLWSAVVQGEYELYGYEYPKVIKKLIERKIVSSRDLMDFSLPRGVEESQRYPVPEMKELMRLGNESDESYKKRKKEKEAEFYNKELKKIQNEINKKVMLNKIKILFGV